MTTAAPEAVRLPGGVLPPRRRLAVSAQAWAARHARSLVILAPVLALVGVVHAVGMSTYPAYVDDPGTYLSQAWAVQYEHLLSPYSYFYDHPPAGWIQIALWSMLTDGFGRYGSAIAFGNECMLIAALVSTALLFLLGRRLGLGRPAAIGASLLFGLSPLAVTYGRWTYLDNLVTPWLLLAFVFAYSPRRSIFAGTAATLSFAMAVLTKETALVILPAFVWAMAHNLDRRNRSQVAVVAGGAGLLLAGLYPLYALYKGELFPGPGHNSLLGTAWWQLAQRQSSGTAMDPGSAVHWLIGRWLAYDPYLLWFGLAAIPVALLVRRLRPAALALVIEWLLVLRGGYVPFMQVINMLPWSALLVAGAVEAVAGRRQLIRDGLLRIGSRAGRPVRILRTGGAALLAAGVLATAAVSWTPALAHAMTVREQPPLRLATHWLADNVPRDRVLVVHDSIWVDLVQRYGFNPKPIIVYKLDTDPAVRRSLKRIDYLVVPNWYYAAPDAAKKYPTLMEARKHAVVVATFGSGDDGVRIYRVSAYWRP